MPTAAEVEVLLKARDQASSVLKSFQGNLENASKSGNAFGSTMGRISQTAMGFAGAQAIITGVSKGFDIAKAAIFDFNSQLQNSRIAFESLLGSGEKADAMLKQLQNFAAKTPFEFPELVKASQSLLNFGFTAGDVIPVLTAVGDSAAVMGKVSGESIQRVITALGQMANKGKVSAEEMMQLSEAGIPGWKLLADAMGKTTGEVQALAEKGLIPVDTAMKALIDGMEKRAPGAMEKMSTTWSGALSNIKDSITQVSAGAMKPLFDMATQGANVLVKFLASDQLKTASEMVAQVLKKIIDALSLLMKGDWVGFGEKIASVAKLALVGVTNLWAFVVGKIPEAIRVMSELAGRAFEWGANLVISFGQGMIEAAGAVVRAAMDFITGLISSFLESFSPPKEGPLKDIDKWGAGLLNAYFKGMSNADFSTLNSVMETVSGVIQELFKSGAIGEVEVIPTGLMSESVIAGIITQWQQFGEVSQESLDMLNTLLGESGIKVGELVTSFLQLQDVQERIEELNAEIDTHKKAIEDLVTEMDKHKDAIDAINEEIDGYKDSLDGVNDKIEDFDKQLKVIDDAFRRQEKIINDAKAYWTDFYDKLNDNIDKTISGLERQLKAKEDALRPDTSGLDLEEAKLRLQIDQNELAKLQGKSGTRSAEDQLKLIQQRKKIIEDEAAIKRLAAEPELDSIRKQIDAEKDKKAALRDEKDAILKPLNDELKDITKEYDRQKGAIEEQKAELDKVRDSINDQIKAAEERIKQEQDAIKILEARKKLEEDSIKGIEAKVKVEQENARVLEEGIKLIQNQFKAQQDVTSQVSAQYDLISRIAAEQERAAEAAAKQAEAEAKKAASIGAGAGKPAVGGTFKGLGGGDIKVPPIDTSKITKDIFAGVDAQLAASFDNLKVSIGNSFKQIFIDAIDKVKETLRNPTLWKAALAPVAAIGPILLGAMAAPLAILNDDVRAKVGSAFENAFNKLGPMLDEIGPKIVPMIKALGTKISEGFVYIKDEIIPMLARSIRDTTVDIATGLASWGASFVSWIGPRIGPMMEALGGLLKDLLSWAKDIALPNIIGGLKDWGGAFVAWLGEVWQPLLEGLGSLLSDIGNWILNPGATTVISKLLEWGKAFVEWVGPATKKLLSNVGDMLDSLTTWIIDTAVPEIVKSLLEWGKAFLGWVAKDVLPDLAKKLGEIVTAIGKWVKEDAAPQLPGKLADIGKAFITVIEDAATAAPAAVKKVVNAIITAANNMKRGFESVANLFGSALDWIAEKLHLPFRVPKVSLPIIPGFEQGVRNYSGGPAIVGEGGPELVTFGPGANVFSNPDTKKLMNTMFNNAAIGPLGLPEMPPIQGRDIAGRILDVGRAVIEWEPETLVEKTLREIREFVQTWLTRGAGNLLNYALGKVGFVVPSVPEFFASLVHQVVEMLKSYVATIVKTYLTGVAQNMPPPPSEGADWVKPLDSYTVEQTYGLTDFARTGIYGRDAKGNPLPHSGYDLGASTGALIHAVDAARVSIASWNGGYGNFVLLQHTEKIATAYGHMSSILTRVGAQVKKAEEIGKVGSTGNSTGPHLHFEVRENGLPVDPSKFIKLDNGGIIDMPIPAMVGGVPEAVIPLSQLRQRIGGGSSGSRINNLNIYANQPRLTRRDLMKRAKSAWEQAGQV